MGYSMGSFEYIPPTLAERLVQYLPTVDNPDMWAEMCMEATVLEGAGPMIQAARLRMPLGHMPEARELMRQAAQSRMIWLHLKSRI